MRTLSEEFVTSEVVARAGLAYVWLWREAGVGQHASNVRDAISCGRICSKLTETVSAS
jgi:hypothetical protein